MPLVELHRAYENWIGGSRPISVLSLRHAEATPHVPHELDILFFQPKKKNGIPQEQFTYLVTAGMSKFTIPGPYQHIELTLCAEGTHPFQQLEKLGRQLAELAVTPFREGSYLAPNLLIREVSLQFFDKMNCVLVTHWGLHEPEYLPGLTPQVLLLSLHPLYPGEADLVEEIGDIEAARRFYHEGINWNDPKRGRAALRPLPVQITHAEFKGGIPVSDKAEPISVVWHAIEKWYQEHAPRLKSGLAAGVSERTLQEFKTRTHLALPEDYQESLKLHNGDVPVHDYTYLPLESVLVVWNAMTQSSKDVKSQKGNISEADRDVIRDVRWHPYWIPFLQDGGGNCICIDMAPGTRGTVGQIINWEQETGPESTPYKSFREWLTTYKDELYQGKYEVDDEGFLEEK